MTERSLETRLEDVFWEKKEERKGEVECKKKRQEIWSEGLGACRSPLTETDGVGATRFSGGSSL